MSANGRSTMCSVPVDCTKTPGPTNASSSATSSAAWDQCGGHMLYDDEMHGDVLHDDAQHDEHPKQDDEQRGL